MSDFMQRQITGQCNWLRVETYSGTEFFPGELCVFVRDYDKATAVQRREYKKEIWQYTGDEPQSWENIKGFGARLSSPGYLDCTEWCVFDSEEEARAYLDEYYPEDEESEPCPC